MFDWGLGLGSARKLLAQGPLGGAPSFMGGPLLRKPVRKPCGYKLPGPIRSKTPRGAEKNLDRQAMMGYAHCHARGQMSNVGLVVVLSVPRRVRVCPERPVTLTDKGLKGKLNPAPEASPVPVFYGLG